MSDRPAQRAIGSQGQQISQLHRLMDQNQQLLLAEQRQSAGLIQEGSSSETEQPTPKQKIERRH